MVKGIPNEVTYKLDNQSLLGRRNTTAYDRFALRCKVQEQSLEFRFESETQRLSVNDDGECGLCAGNETSVLWVQRRRAEYGSDFVATGFNL